MTAVEFIQKFGWDVAITDLRSHEKHGTRSILYIYDELKRYVGAYELVRRYINRESGQWFFIADYCRKVRISPFNSENYERVKSIYLDALALVEQIESSK